MSRRSDRALAGLALVLAAAAVACVGWSLSPEPVPAPVRAAPALLSCGFSAGEHRAYAVSSTVSSFGQEDRFHATLSLHVVETRPALLRAAFSDVRLEQALSESADRVPAEALEGAPFFLRVDARCQLTEIGFSPSFEPAGRRLVTDLLRASEIVLPGAAIAAWEARQEDGGGPYVATYEASPTTDGVRIVRRKSTYEARDDALRLGVALRVLESRAEALFDPETRSLGDVRGQELLRLTVPGRAPVPLTHRFTWTRRDGSFTRVASASLSEADFGESVAPTVVDEAPDPVLAQISRDEALGQFHQRFAELGNEAVLPAAQALARWLRANPDEAEGLLADLRAGAIAEHAHATLFLALQLAGTDESRVALVEALGDDGLVELNRARAAAALADHGAPTSGVASELLARAHDDESPLVANVSRLGYGTLAGRAEGELGESLRDTLGAELAAAEGAPALVTAIESIGNCADDRFAPSLTSHLGAADPTVRAHAAEALGQLSPELARPALLEQLADEEDPRVAASLLRGLRRVDADGALSEADLSLALSQLASPSAEVRAGAIEWLGQAAAQGEVRRVLASHFHRESDLRLQRRLGAFVSAAELRAAG